MEIAHGSELLSAHQRFTLPLFPTRAERESEASQMEEKRFYRRWRRQYLRGLKQTAKMLARCRKTGAPVPVHELRVAIRRTRLLAVLGRPLIGRERAMGFRAWGRHIADTLSQVRDYDVMIEWLQTVCRDVGMVERLRQDRQKAWIQAREGVRAMSKQEWKQLFRLKSEPKKKRELKARYEKICASTRKLVELDAETFERLDPTERHNFRRALRRLRYLQELRPKSERKERTKILAKLQEVLGEVQNAQAMKSLLRDQYKRFARRSRVMSNVRRYESEWMPRCRRSLNSVINSFAVAHR